MDSLLEPDQDGQERQFRKDLRGARASLNRLQKLFGPRSVQQRTTIGQEIKEAADLIAPWLGNITLKTPTDFPDIPFKESNYALSLILLVLFENSIAARWAAALSKQCASIFP